MEKRDGEGCEGCGGLTRREALAAAAKAMFGVTVVGVALPVLEGCGVGSLTGLGNGPTATKFDVSKLTQDGQALVTSANGPDGAPVLIVRESAGSFLAMSMLCTHALCIVGAPHSGVLTCPCHGSQYNLQGQVLRGPAFRPLARYNVAYDATTNMVTIS